MSHSGSWIKRPAARFPLLYGFLLIAGGFDFLNRINEYIPRMIAGIRAFMALVDGFDLDAGTSDLVDIS
ncbi:hypothetical protein K3X25_14495 [Aliiroseovarius crassostreae]|nr:hypothetical protein [Aliiroseovarius crassostreae]UWQ07921.1 hypothetical protein K3X25_14495 [Aliiroseovarius crassostreae]